MKLYAINDQITVNLAFVMIIEDSGFDLEVTMMNGRRFSVPGSRRSQFFDAALSAES